MVEICFHLQFTEIYVDDVMTARHAKKWSREVYYGGNRTSRPST